MPKDGTATRTRILDAAERLVIENGYAATSVDQVVAASGSSKGAFFHHFSSKLELARTLVQRYAEADVAQLRAAMAHAEAATLDPVGRVEAFLQWFEDRYDTLLDEDTSCLYISILTERELVLDGTSEPILDAVIAWRTDLTRIIGAALQGGDTGLDAEALADHVFVTFEGAFLLARSTRDPSHMRTQLRVLRQLLGATLRNDVRR
ncbi:MAG: TetR/AcrR family transcriptional regulator [Nocardioides sp.]